jgi:spore germination cell wall hydrolase CwlJ-like protein
MIPAPYESLSSEILMALCCWREARGEGMLGKRGVCHVILTRATHDSWWGSSITSVILKPFQFSSFNMNDPNSVLWPEDNDVSWVDSQIAAEDCMDGTDEDPTSGAQYYHDVSIPTPPDWIAAGYVETIQIGRLKFFRES